MAKRVNTPFLIILTAVVVAFAGLLLGIRFFGNRNPKKFIAAGEAAFAAKDYEKAANYYRKAISLDRGNPDLYVRFGEIMEYRIVDDPQSLSAARSAWNEALVSDTTNSSALNHLLNSYIEEMELHPNPGVFPQIRSVAGKIAQANPSDTRAKAYKNFAIVLQSQHGIMTEDRTVQESVLALVDLSKKNPSDGDLLYFAATGKMWQINDARKKNDKEKADRLLSELMAMVDSAVAAQPDNANFNWRASQIYFALEQMDSANAEHYRDVAAAAIGRAEAKVKPQDPRYIDIGTFDVAMLVRQKKMDESEKVLREMYKQQPTNALARLDLARLLMAFPKKREEGIELLTTPFSAEGLKGIRALDVKEYEVQRLYLLTNARLDAYALSTDPARRKLLLDQIDETFKSLNNLVSVETVSVLRLEGRIQEIKGQTIEAIGTLQRGLNLMERNGTKDYDLIYQAGRLDMAAGQDVMAAKLLSEFAKVYESSVPARYMLVQIYLRQHNTDEAQRYIDELEKLLPKDSADLIQYRVALLAAQNNMDGAKQYYTKMPESTPQEQRTKAQVALDLKEHAEAVRLLEKVRAQAPDDVSVCIALAQSYAQLDQKDKADRVVADGLKRKPAEPRLLILQKRLANASPEEIRKLAEQLRMSSGDEFSHEMQAAQLAAGSGKIDEALTHLATADKLKPANRYVHEMYYQIDVSQRRFDQAAKEIPVLARLNADGADGWVFRTRLALTQGNLPLAIKNARELVNHRPDFAESHTLLGEALQADGQLDDALWEYNSALDHQSSNLDALRERYAEVSLKLNKPDKAHEYISRGREFFPASVGFREMSLNYDLLYSPTPEKVLDERTKILAANPEDPANYIALARTALHLAQLKASTDVAQSKSFATQAQNTLNKGLTKWPDDLRIASELAGVMQSIGDSAAGEKILTNFAARPNWKDRPEPQRSLAGFYMVDRNGPAAEAALRTALAKSGNSMDIQEELADFLSQQHRYDDALKVLEINASDPHIARQRLAIHINAHHTEEAEKEIQQALAATPNSPELLNMLTKVYVDAGRLDEARKTVKQAVLAGRQNDGALTYQAYIELRSPDGDLDLAQKNLTTVKEHNPQNALARLSLVDLYMRRGHQDQALHELESLLRAVPTNREVRVRLLSAYSSTNPPDWQDYDKLVADAEANLQLNGDPIWLRKDGEGRAARQQYRAAIMKYHSALKLAPQDSTVQYDLLNALLGAHDAQAAIAEADNMLAGGKKQWWAYYMRGQAKALSDKKAALDDLDLALATTDASHDFSDGKMIVGTIASAIGYDEALQRAQRHNELPWKFVVISLYHDRGDLAEMVHAAEALRASSDLTPDQRQLVVRTLASGYQTLKQPQNSLKAYQELIESVPNDATVLNNMAYLLADDLHDPKQAKSYSQRALQLVQKSGGNVPMISDTHGWVLTLCGGRDAQAGLNILQQLVDDNPNFIDARSHLAEAYIRSAQPEEAQKQVQIALDQIKAMEDRKAPVSPELKASLQETMNKTRQMLNGKADASGK